MSVYSPRQVRLAARYLFGAALGILPDNIEDLPSHYQELAQKLLDSIGKPEAPSADTHWRRYKHSGGVGIIHANSRVAIIFAPLLREYGECSGSAYKNENNCGPFKVIVRPSVETNQLFTLIASENFPAGRYKTLSEAKAAALELDYDICEMALTQ